MDLHAKAIREIILGGVIGDALGTPLEGLSRGHIRAVFKTIASFIDPQPALKNKMHRWRKPGFYSSISQVMLLCALSTRAHKREGISGLFALLARLPSVAGSQTGILRHPGRAEIGLLSRLVRESGSPWRPSEEPSARAIPIVAPAALLDGADKDICLGAARLCLLFSSESCSIAGCIIHSLLMQGCAETNRKEQGNVLGLAIEIAGRIRTRIDEAPEKFFNLGANPETLHRATTLYLKIFNGLAAAHDRESAERLICANAAAVMKIPPAHATVDHPLCLLPFAVFISGTRSDPEDILSAAAAEGGSSAVLCSLCGEIAGATRSTDWAHHALMRDLANKRRIIGIVEAIASEKITEPILADFLSAEAALTAKEIEEHAARNKHNPRKEKPTSSRKDAERRIAQTVAESWTKADKARWKKEKSRYDKRRD